jgi:hypothetical protein
VRARNEHENDLFSAEVKAIPDQVEVAHLWGFDICMQPLASLVRSDWHNVYGIICQITHAELHRLYGQHWVRTYLPEAVLVEINGGRLVPALSYIAPPLPVASSAPIADDYLDRIVGPAHEYGFPTWYLTRLESFRQYSRSKE